MPLQSDKLRLLRRIPDIRFDEDSPGFSKDQVNRVLANLAPLADEIERLQNRLAEAEERAHAAESRLVEARGPSQAGESRSPAPVAQPDFDETLRNTLVSAQRQADLTIREATEEAERLRTEAEFQSNALLADARDQSAEMTTEAVSYRERLMAEAVEERAKRLDEAREEADGLVAEVKRELVDAHEQERSSLISQIEQLQEKHRQLQDDVERFEAHLQSRSDEVRASAQKILAVLDEPELLRSDEDFEAAGIAQLDHEDFPSIDVSVAAHEELQTKADIAAEAVSPPREAVEVDEFDHIADDVDEFDQFGAVDEDEVLADESLAESSILEDDRKVADDSPAISQPIFSDDDPNTGSLEEPVDGDRYHEELLRATTEEPDDDDAISDFLEDKPDRTGGGWFGRRR